MIKIQFKGGFFRTFQLTVWRETTKPVLLMNLPAIGCLKKSKWCCSLIHKASINKSVPVFFDILIGCLNISTSKFGATKKYARRVELNWTPRGKIC